MPRELDARLAVAACAGWAASLVARAYSWPAVLAMAIASLGVAGGSLMIDYKASCRSPAAGLRARSVSATQAGAVPAGAVPASRRRRPTDQAAVARIRMVPAVALLGVSGLLLPLAARLYLVRDGPLASMAALRSAAVVDATVTADPRPVGPAIAPAVGSAVGSADGPPARVAVNVRLTGIRTSGGGLNLRVPAVVMASGAGWAGILPGQHVRFDGRLSPARDNDLLGATITTSAPPTLVGRPPWWQRSAETVRTGLRRASSGLPARERGLLPGLVDGDTSRLDPLLAQQFRTAGLSHLVAVSGTNVAIVVGAILLLARRLRAPPWFSAGLGAVVLAGFLVVARPSPSVLRAVVMAAVLLVALATGRARAALPALALAVIVLLAWQPTWAADAGFAMSVLATAALLMLAPGWADALRRRRLPPGLAEGLAVASAAGVATAPVIVLLSGQVSLVSVPANLVAELAVAPATVLGVLAAACGPWCPPLAAGLAQLAGVPCRWLTTVAAAAAGLPGATLPWPADIAGAVLLVGVSVVLAAALSVRRLRVPLAAALLTVVVVQVPVRMWADGWPAGGAILVACDVGQGDGLVIPVAAHAAIVVDDGRNPVPIDRCLRSLGISAVPLLVLSHFDLDHVGGTPGVVAGRQVGHVLTSPLQEPALGHGIVHGALDPRGVPTFTPPTGAVLDVGPARVEVLASRSAQAGGQPDSNDSSLVVRVEVRGRSMLFLGDAAEEEQQYLLAEHARLGVDVLKVAHHGSAHFEPALYAATHASLAVVSVGAHNPYGHPTARALNELARLSMPVVRTDVQGDIAVVPTATGLRTVSHPSHQTVRARGAGASSRLDVQTGTAMPAHWTRSVRTDRALKIIRTTRRALPTLEHRTDIGAAARAPPLKPLNSHVYPGRRGAVPPWRRVRWSWNIARRSAARRGRAGHRRRGVPGRAGRRAGAGHPPGRGSQHRDHRGRGRDGGGRRTARAARSVVVRRSPHDHRAIGPRGAGGGRSHAGLLHRGPGPGFDLGHPAHRWRTWQGGVVRRPLGGRGLD